VERSGQGLILNMEGIRKTTKTSIRIVGILTEILPWTSRLRSRVQLTLRREPTCTDLKFSGPFLFEIESSQSDECEDYCLLRYHAM
jgi:hypothetical protein